MKNDTEGAASAPTKLVGALAAGLAILRHLTRARTPLGVSQIARDLDLNPSTCFNLLKTLVHERLVLFDDRTKTYSLGLGFVEMAKGALERASFARLARPHLDAIAGEFRVTMTLWQRTGRDRVVLVERADNDDAMRVHMSIGQRLPALIGALGRCIAAFDKMSETEIRARFRALRWQDPPEIETYLAEVKAARAHGYAIDMDRYVRGVITVSAPVLDDTTRPVMALSAIGFSGQFSPVRLDALAQSVKHRAEQLSEAITGGSR